MENGTYPAFPLDAKTVDENYAATWSHGLTKREYFAGLMLQGWIANSTKEPKCNDYWGEVASNAVSAADALLKELNK